MELITPGSKTNKFSKLVKVKLRVSCVPLSEQKRLSSYFKGQSYHSKKMASIGTVVLSILLDMIVWTSVIKQNYYCTSIQ